MTSTLFLSLGRDQVRRFTVATENDLFCYRCHDCGCGQVHYLVSSMRQLIVVVIIAGSGMNHAVFQQTHAFEPTLMTHDVKHPLSADIFHVDPLRKLGQSTRFSKSPFVLDCVLLLSLEAETRRYPASSIGSGSPAGVDEGRGT